MNLAYTLRPNSLTTYIGQQHLVGKGKILYQMIQAKQISSMIFWGPPGVGKTTLAYLIAKESDADFHVVSAVESGKDALRKIISSAQKQKEIGKKTILFIDEIHRWNKAQQDSLLPHVESGLITLIGATTENPSFEVISALLSRSRVFVLKPLVYEDLLTILDQAISYVHKTVFSEQKKEFQIIEKDAKDLLISYSGGDARIMLNAFEIAAQMIDKDATSLISTDLIREIFQKKSSLLYDKKGEEHYNTISAYIKSMRGSDVDAALYYLARMLEGGEDPTFIARRMIIFASEDIGLADRGALIQANAGFEAVQKIGMPEAQLILAHITVYLSLAAKSRAVTDALGKAKQAVYDHPDVSIPLHLRNAPTRLMKQVGYAKGYQWSEGDVGLTEGYSYLPDTIKGTVFFEKKK